LLIRNCHPPQDHLRVLDTSLRVGAPERTRTSTETRGNPDLTVIYVPSPVNGFPALIKLI